MTAVCATMGVARSHIHDRLHRPSGWRDGRRSRSSNDTAVLAEIKVELLRRPTYGYRRIHGRLQRRRRESGAPPVNHKRIYRVMKAHDLLFAEPESYRPGPVHDGRIMTEASNQRWCTDGFEFRCDNGEPIRVAFSLDCCDREAMSWAATTRGVDEQMVQDLMLQAVEQRFGLIDQLPTPIEWLSDNGSPFVSRETRRFAQDIGLVTCRTAVRSPQSNGMAEAFVKTFKRDYVDVQPKPDAQSVLQSIGAWFDDYNENHPHKALKWRSPREFRRQQRS